MGGHGRAVRLGARGVAPGPPAPGAFGRPHPGERRRGDRGRTTLRGRRGERSRSGRRPQGPRQTAPLLCLGRACDRTGLMPAAGELEQRFGRYGGRYVPETLMPALAELERAWLEARGDAGFRRELDGLLATYVGRPTPLYRAARLSDRCGSTVFLKREDLLHTGAHKINNALGQTLLAKRLGKGRIVAETGAGRHGVAAATACALLGLDCVVYMGTEDMRRQRPNVERMDLLGAEVRAVEAGARTLKAAVSEAIRDRVANVADTHYVNG